MVGGPRTRHSRAPPCDLRRKLGFQVVDGPNGILVPPGAGALLSTTSSGMTTRGRVELAPVPERVLGEVARAVRGLLPDGPPDLGIVGPGVGAFLLWGREGSSLAAVSPLLPFPGRSVVG